MDRLLTRFLERKVKVNTHVEVTPATDHTPVIFREFTEGWPGGGFHSSVTELKARRVINSSRGEEIQLSFALHENKGISKRTYTTYSSMTLTPQQADALIEALTKLKT